MALKNISERFTPLELVSYDVKIFSSNYIHHK